MKKNHTHGHCIKRSRLFGVVSLFSVLFFGSSTVSAQGCGPVNCNPATGSGSGKVCSVSAYPTCPSGGAPSVTITFTAGTNANCNNGMATHTVGQAPTATCTFRFVRECSRTYTSMISPTSPSGYSTTTTLTSFYPTTETCRIEVADGLPVELMGFEIQD